MNSGHHCVCASDEWRTLVREQVLPWALAQVDLGDDVIELGPGFGATTDVLREQVPRLTAVEIDPGLAGALADRLDGANVEIVTGDATALGFEDRRFSAAASFSMLHHVPSAALQDRLFSEACRVLRPNGVLVALDSLESEGLRAFHRGDTFVPIHPRDLPRRIADAGFVDVEIEQNEFAWKARARRPSP